MDNDTILFTCKQIHTNPDMTCDEIETLKSTYPKLYEYARSESNYDEDMLRQLLDYKANMNGNYLETNMTVAEHIADKYLYNDTFQRPDEDVMEQYRNKIRKLNKKR